MTDIDVSIVFNMHREALFLAPTMYSLRDAALEARDAGLKVELIAVFDRPDAATKLAFAEHDLSVYQRVEIIEVDVGSLGLARNAGVERATGEYIWTSDADDLVSSNAIVALHSAAREVGHTKVAVFLEYLCAFGEQYHNVRYVDAAMLTAADFALQHPFVSRIFVHRSTFEAVRYQDLRVTSGFAYEDWFFNCELRGLGYELTVAPDTIIFYRQRPGSLLRQANAASVRLIPHSKLFDTDVFLADMAECRHAVGDWASFMTQRRAVFDEDNTALLMNSEKLQGFLRDAMKLEPEIEPARVEAAPTYSPMPWRADHWGMQLEQFYRLIGAGKFTDVILLPWLNPGGAEKYILQVLDQVAAAEPDARFLVLSGEGSKRHAWVSRLPAHSVFVDVYNAFPTLESADSDAMVIRALLAVTQPNARIHVKSSAFAHRLLDTFGPVLCSNYRIVYYRFSDGTYQWRGEILRGPWGAGVMRRHLPGLWRVLSDCQWIVESDRLIMGPLSKYHTVYARADVDWPVLPTRLPRRRLLWASRIAAEKRPELIARIAEALVAAKLDVSIDVYGTSDEGLSVDEVFHAAPGNVAYRGPFKRASEIPVESYDAFVYTSSFDGLPNILVEMLGAGLPAIAPDVGGIGELVMDGATGWLIPSSTDEQMVASYVKAISELYADWEESVAKGVAGRQLVEKRHGPQHYAAQVSKVLELNVEKFVDGLRDG